MDVGRLPLFAFAILASTTIAVAVISGALALRRRTRNIPLRGVLAAIAALAVLGAAVLGRLIAEPWIAAAPRASRWVHLGPLVDLVPPIASVLLVASARWLFPEREDARAARSRLAYVAVVLAFAGLNVMNTCSPGWCGRYGFPFAYWWRSDAIVIINGTRINDGFRAIALAADVAVLAGIITALAVRYRRAAPR